MRLNNNKSSFENYIFKIGNGEYIEDNNTCLKLDICIVKNNINI